MTISELPAQLDRLGLISGVDVTNDGIQITDISRRNQNFRVLIGEDRGYLVKCARDASASRALAAEAASYSAIHSLSAFSVAKRWVPAVSYWQSDPAMLITELLPNAVGLHQVRSVRIEEARAIGTALGELHDAGVRSSSRPEPNIPWVLTIHRPRMDLFADVSPANLRMIEILQKLPSTCADLDRLMQIWSVDSTIHFDIKWDNWIAEYTSAGRLERLAIVDWEFACAGDSAWDVGAVLADFLGSWIHSMPVAFGAIPENFDRLAASTVNSIQPAVRAFCAAYRRARGGQATVLTWNLIRAVRFSAARLIHRTWERHQSAPELSGHGVAAIQVASHILREPHIAAVRIFGIPLG